MKTIKKIFIFASVCILFAFFVQIKTEATSPSIRMIEGAQIRTQGVQGLRFSCIASNDFDGITEHGFFLAKGNYDRTEFINAINTSNKIEDNNIIRVPTNGTDKAFACTIYNITSEYYEDYITAVAYIKERENYTFSSVCISRNIADVAFSAYNNGINNDYIVDILEETKIKVIHSNGNYNYYSHFNDIVLNDNDTIKLNAKIYDEDITINKDGISIIGPNENISGCSDARKKEARFASTITVSASIDNFTIKGVLFEGNASIFFDKQNEAGASNNVLYNHDNFLFQNNIVLGSTNSNKDGFIFFEEENYNYSRNITIDNCLFSGSFAARSIIGLNNHINLNITNNKFVDANKEVLRVYDQNKGAAGNVIIENNEFCDLVDGGLYFRWISPIVTATYEVRINNNLFKNIPYVALGFRGGNNGEKYTNFAINQNEFINVKGCVHYNLRLNCTRTFNYNKIYQNNDSNSYIVKFIKAAENEITETTYPLDCSYNLYASYDGNTIYKTLDEITNGGFDYNSAATNIDNNIFTSLNALNSAIVGNLDASTRIENEIERLSNKYSEVALIEKDIDFETSDNIDFTTISWTSSNPSIISNDGIYNAPIITIPVRFTAEVSYQGSSSSIEFVFLASAKASAINIKKNQSRTLIDQYYDYLTIWDLSDESIISINNGTLSANNVGQASFSYTNEFGLFSFDVYVYESDLIDLLIQGNHEEVNLVSIEYGESKVKRNVFEAINDYYFGEISINNSVLLEMTNQYTYGTFQYYGYPIQFVVVHDTANTASGANAHMHANYLKNDLEPGEQKSWHYSVDDASIYQHVEETYTAFHAGCQNKAFVLQDTGVDASLFNNEAPIITIDANGYFAVNGISTSLRPYQADAQWSIDNNTYTSSQICDYGIYYSIGQNGNYYLNKTYFNTTYNKVSNFGGNTNGIGLEMCVNSDSDVYHTWQRGAKLIAQILVRHNLTPHEVLPHNAFSGKDCAYSLLENGRWDDFMKLVEMEYQVLKYYSDYTITFESLDENIISSNGRVNKNLNYDTKAGYKITITKNQVSEEIVLYTKINS